jgi:predicted HTH transcriptional regulator
MTLTVTELLAELAEGESQHRAFKRQLDHPESVAGEIVAFANSDDDATGRELLRIARAAGELHYDRKALGEAVVNAIAHRDYTLLAERPGWRWPRWLTTHQFAPNQGFRAFR